MKKMYAGRNIHMLIFQCQFILSSVATHFTDDLTMSEVLKIYNHLCINT